MIGTAHDAADLAQDAYVRFFQLPHAELVRNPQAYLYRIAANLVYEYRVRALKGHVFCDPSALEQLADRNDEMRERGPERALSTSQQLDRALRLLPPMYRAVLILQKRDGLSYEEIAQHLDLSVHTVHKYLFQALALCRAAHAKLDR
jgi:RNA polymerase sigma factor (sigma-70 family)